MSFGLGFWAAAGAGGETSSYELISTNIVSGSSTTVLEFTSIPQSYKHLQVRYTNRTSASSTGQASTRLGFNGNYAGNFTYHRLYGNGSSVLSEGGTGLNVSITGFVTGANAATNNFAAGVIDILDYSSTTKYKTFRSLAGLTASTDNRVSLASGVFLQNTNALTSMFFSFDDGTNFVAGSRFSLYGIKG